eukprot:1781290-Ditylum_brightwellii.AAC.1
MYAAVIKNQRDSKQTRDQKEASDPNSCPKDANKHNNWQSNGSHSSMTYRCFGKPSTSGRESYHSHQDSNQHSLGRHHNDDCQNNYSGKDCNNDCQ